MFNTEIFHIVLMFLKMNLDYLSAQLQSDIANNRVALDNQVLDIRKEIAGGGTIDLIDATTQRIDGICSFDKNVLQTGRAVIFDEVAITYKTDAASGKEGSLKYDGAVPGPLLNALFIINQNGRERLRMPIGDLNNISAGRNTSDQYTKMKALGLLADDKTITMQIKFAPGVVLDPATKHYIHVRLSGLQTSIKA